MAAPAVALPAAVTAVSKMSDRADGGARPGSAGSMASSKSSSAAGQKRKSASSPLEGMMMNPHRRSSNLSNNNHHHLKRSPRSNLARSATGTSLHAPEQAATSSSSAAASSSSSSAQASSSASSSRPQMVYAGAASRNILLEEEYQDEVINYMQSMESLTMPNIELMDVQPELRWYMRPFLVDFLIEIHQTFRLRPETLYLTMNIVDRYVSKRIVYKRHYQLIGCAALLIAAKYEDAKNHIPAVQDLSQTCCNAYDETAFTQMEGHVLSTIGWQLGFPTPEAWLRIACTQIREESKIQSVARFLMEATLFHKDFVGVNSSAIAGGSLMLARHICGEQTRRPEFDNEAVCKAAQLIDAHMSEHVKELSQILIKKYSGSTHSHASKLTTEWYAKQNGVANESRRSSMAVLGHLQQHQQQQQQQQAGKLDRSTTLEAVSASSHGSGTDDEDESMSSSPTTPSSLSTRSSRSGHVDDEEEEDEDEEPEDDDADDEDDDMPVTPLSLYSLHDPLAAAAASIEPSVAGAVGGVVVVPPGPGGGEKENSTNGMVVSRPDLCEKQQAIHAHHHHHHHLVQQPTVVHSGSRTVLRNATWDCNMQL